MHYIEIVMTVLVALMGVMIGSFLNVLIIRIPRNEGFMMGRSHCMSCEKTLHWYELIPLFSWLFLRGKCSKCKAKISAQYPLIEATNGILWAVVFLNFGLTIDTLLSCLLTSALLVLSVIDARTREIPPQTTIFIAILGLVRLVLNFSDWQSHVLGFLVISGILLLLLIVSNGTAIGGGDVKLMAGAGLFLGFAPTILAFFVGCIIGSVIHIVKMRFFGANRDLAMGPYLAVGVFLALIWGNGLIEWYMSLLFN